MTDNQLKSLYAIGNEATREYLKGACPYLDFEEVDMQPFYDACEKTGYPKEIDLSSFPEKLRSSTWWEYVVKVCTEAINGGERIDLFDKDKSRHYPWCDTEGSPARCRFRDAYCDYTSAHAGSGSRLSFLSEEKAKEAGKTLLPYYKKLLSE
jgi:hypothetical protein